MVSSRSSAGLAVAFAMVIVAGCSSRRGVGPSELATTGPVTAPLCVTEGQVRPLEGGKMEVADPAMRAIALGTGGDAAELEFVYEGPSAGDAPLASGELRRQIGLKLRAADTCNVVYVMWHIEPTSGLAISVKRNPGMTRHTECRDGGYQTIKATREEHVPEIREGEAHRLRATLDGETLRVHVDGRLAWEGNVGEDALSFDGPIGIRSDNGRFLFRIVGQRGRKSDCRDGSVVAAG